MLANHFLENVPNNWLLAFNHFACLLDGGRVTLLFQLVVDEGLEEFERHLLRQATLVQLQLRTNNDHGASRIVNALAKQVLSKTSLLAFERSTEGLERTIVDTA